MAKPNTTSGILDIHCHVAGIGAGNSGCHISSALRNSFKCKAYFKAFGVTKEELAQKGDALIVKRLSRKLKASTCVTSAVALAMDGVVGPGGELDLSKSELYVPNEFVAQQVRAHDNLYFGASINPYRVDAMERLEYVYRAGAVLIKWLPSIQDIDPSDKKLIPFYLRMKELGLPLLTHTGSEHAFSRARDELADPWRLRLPLDLGVMTIAAHTAPSRNHSGHSNLKILLRMFSQYTTLYADISSLTQVNRLGHIPRLMRHNGIEGRLLYGSDMPLLETIVVSPLFFGLKLAPSKIINLFKITNPWDRDVQLKKYLGIPEQVFTRAWSVLRMPEEQKQGA